MSTTKYQIGDKLCHVADQTLKVFVVAVLTEECPGGVQYHYHCRTFEDGTFSAALIKFNEIELIEIPEKGTILDLMQTLKSAAIEAGDMELAAEIREAEKRLNDR